DATFKSIFLSANQANGTALRIRYSWNINLDDVWVWFAKYGIESDQQVQSTRMRQLNVNAVQYGVIGTFNQLSIRDSTFQQYTKAAIALGVSYETHDEGTITSLASSPTIDGNYFEVILPDVPDVRAII